MRICHISDCHDVARDLNRIIPDKVDILFISGDMTYQGSDNELGILLKQLVILKSRIKHIICIAGNHELGCERNPQIWKKSFEEIGCVLLFHEAIEIEGLKIFGSPYTPEFLDWAFMYKSNEAESMWNSIPKDTQILVTHGPPKGILDKCAGGNVGCPALKNVVTNCLPNLKYHMFGHIHEGYGTIVENGITFSNASLMDGKYSFINKSITFKL